MALSWLIRMAGHFEGLSDQELDMIDQAMPATRKLIELSVKFKPIMEEALPLWDKVKPIIQEAQPVIQKALPIIDEAKPLVDQAEKEWEKIAPVVLLLIKKFTTKNPGRSVDSDWWANYYRGANTENVWPT